MDYNDAQLNLKKKIYIYYTPSLHHLPILAGSWRNWNFWRSAYVSANRPITNSPVPAESSVVIVRGAGGIELWGELMNITGRLTIYTQIA